MLLELFPIARIQCISTGELAKKKTTLVPDSDVIVQLLNKMACHLHFVLLLLRRLVLFDIEVRGRHTGNLSHYQWQTIRELAPHGDLDVIPSR